MPIENKGHVTDRRSILRAGAVLGLSGGLAGCLEYVPGSSGDREFVTIGTGGTGGVYYPLGGGMAGILNDNIENVRASAESTGASVENCRLVGQREMTMALALGNAVLLAVNGEGDFSEPMPLSAAFAAYMNNTQVVTLADSDITGIPDLEGKRVSVGAPGSGTEVIANELLAFYGLTYDDINVQRLSFGETGSALQDGQLDAGFWSVAYPASSIQNLASLRDIRLLDFPEKDIQALADRFPYYSNATIPAGAYPGQTEPVDNPGVPNVMVVHEGMSENLAYRIAKAVYENLDSLAEVHPAANQFEETARKAPIDLHPGSKRYFDEVGL